MREYRTGAAVLLSLLVWQLLFWGGGKAHGHVYQDFDSLPATAEMGNPESGTAWKYTSDRTNSRENIKSCGWYNSNSYQSHPTIYDYFNYYRNTYNTPNMGFETYGFLEIDGSNAVKGNSLRVTVTGGRNAEGEVGKPVFCKEDYLRLIKSGGVREKGRTRVGHPYVYFCNNSSSQKPIPFPYAGGCNRLSLYVRMPEMSNGAGGAGNPPQQSIHVGPFNSVGGHWYHQFYNQGGGWTHLVIDGHPQHNNAWHNHTLYPYPSSSLRDMGTEYFSTMYRWYITFLPYSGIGVPPYHVWIDEIEFYHDPEPQNNETVCSPAVTFHADSKLFEIGFNDKYKNNGESRSTYEVRYSFSEITNDNFIQARPVMVQPDSRFGITRNAKGVFNKWWPYYQAVWAPFRLNAVDENRLKPGMRIYFAIRDLSSRPYGVGTFDQEGDTMIVGTPGKRRIDLINRIDFVVDKNYAAGQAGERPPRVRGLRVD